MEIIRKKTGIDRLRSHQPGILPYIPYNGTPMKTYVKGGSVNGNYGQYVCDFVIYSGYTSSMSSEIMTGSSMTIKSKKELMRCRYLDIIRKYNFIKERLRNGVYVRRYAVDLDGVGETQAWYPVEISMSSDDCGVIGNGMEGKSKYSFRPAEITDFIYSEGLYTYGGSDATILNEDYLVLINDCSKVLEYNNEWNGWWAKAAAELNVSITEAKSRFFGTYSGPENSDFALSSDVDRYILGLIEVPSDIEGSRVPAEIYYTAINDQIKWFDRNRSLYEYAVKNPSEENEKIINLWREKGGKTDDNKDENNFYDFLKKQRVRWITEISPSWAEGAFPAFAPPVMEYEMLTVNEVGYEKLYTPYEYSVEGDGTVPAWKEYVAPEKNMVGSGLTPRFVSFSGGEDSIIEGEPLSESMLETVQSPRKIQVSDGLVGIFESFSDSESGVTGQLFLCRYCAANVNRIPEDHAEKPGTQVIFDHVSGDTYYYWYCRPVDIAIPCGDDESIGPNVRKYRNVTVLSTVPYVINPDGNPNTNPVAVNNEYYFRAAYKNGVYAPYGSIDNPSGKISYLELPYETGVRLNVTSYISGNSFSQNDFESAVTSYDMVSKIAYNDNEITIEYVIGATSGESSARTGIHYRETIPYETGRTVVSVDNGYMGEIYYKKADVESAKEYVYSDEYRLYRKANRARITGMEVGCLWTSGAAIETPLITRDGTEGLMEEPKYDVNVEYNRGAAAAWENHFKLSECNTMEDLEKYGNNVFNL